MNLLFIFHFLLTIIVVFSRIFECISSEWLILLAGLSTYLGLLYLFQFPRFYVQFFVFFLLVILTHVGFDGFFYWDEWSVIDHYKDMGFSAAFTPHNEHFLPLFFFFWFFELEVFGEHYKFMLLISWLLMALVGTLLSRFLFEIGEGDSRGSVSALLAGMFVSSGLHANVAIWSFLQCILLMMFFLLLGAHSALNYLKDKKFYNLFIVALACLFSPLFFASGFLSILLLVFVILQSAFAHSGVISKEDRKRIFVVLSSGFLGCMIAGVLYFIHVDIADQQFPSEDFVEVLKGIFSYVYSGVFSGTFIRGFGLVLEATPSYVSSLIGESNTNLALVILGTDGFLLCLILSFVPIVANKYKMQTILWIFGSLCLIVGCFLLLAMGRWKYEAIQSFESRYQFIALVFLAFWLFPIVQTLLKFGFMRKALLVFLLFWSIVQHNQRLHFAKLSRYASMNRAAMIEWEVWREASLKASNCTNCCNYQPKPDFPDTIALGITPIHLLNLRDFLFCGKKDHYVNGPCAELFSCPRE